MYRKLWFNDGYNKKIRDLIGSLFKIGRSGRLVPKDPAGSLNIPWIFTNDRARRKFCSLWNSIYCGQFNLIPTPCRFSCWKIVIKPPTVKALFHVYQKLQQLDLPAKCGVDQRDYTYGPYAGFIYADSLAEGRRYYKLARAKIHPSIPIILKRGCTEMERNLPSDQWDNVTEADIRLEERLNDLFDFSEIHFTQAEWLRSDIKERWIKHAIKIGDPTAREMAERLSDDPDIWKRLCAHAVTYHDKQETVEGT